MRKTPQISIFIVVLLLMCSVATAAKPAKPKSVKAPAIPSYSSADWVDMVLPAKNARGIGIDSRGRVVAAAMKDWARLKQFAPNGDFLSNIYFRGRYATNITIGPKDSLWVVGDGPIVKFDLSGTDRTVAARAGSRGKGKGQYNAVRAVAVGPDGRLFVADCLKGRILVFGPNGKFQKSWTGTGPYKLSQSGWSLTGMTVDAKGRVYVVDQPKKRVVVFGPDGKGLRILGRGVFNSPAGVAVDAKGNCYVSDKGARRIYLFDPKGKCLSYLDLGGSGPGAMKYPWGMTVDKHGDLWVADADGPRAYRFATARLLWSLARAGVNPAATQTRKASVKLSIPVKTFPRPVLVPLTYLRERLANAGTPASVRDALDATRTTVSIGGKAVASQAVDLRGDGPGGDNLLAFELPAAPADAPPVEVKISWGDAAKPSSVPSNTSTITAQYDARTGMLRLQNDRYRWRLSTGDGSVRSVVSADGKRRAFRGKGAAVQLTTAGEKGENLYRTRIVAAGPVVAAAELTHIAPTGRRLVRTLWLWRGEPFLREWLDTSSVGEITVVHRADGAGLAGPSKRRAFPPDRPLAASFKTKAGTLAVAFDETTPASDGYLVQRRPSKKIPGRVLASFKESRNTDTGVEQTITLRSSRLGQLRWAIGLGKDIELLWRRINVPVVIDGQTPPRRSRCVALKADQRFRATTKPNAPLCDFYNMEATFPGLGDLMSNDIDKCGFLHAKGEGFEFDDGTRVNSFLGGTVEWTGFQYLCTNGLPGRGQPPVGRVGVDQVIAWLAACGNTFVRWHHHDHPKVNWIADQHKSTIRPEALDIFHYFLYRCRQKGIRVHFGSLLIDREFGRILPGLGKCHGTWNPDVPGNIVPLYNARAIQMQKEFATNLLTSYNPYTKCRVVDDPTLAMVGIENERLLLSAPGRGVNRWDRLPEPYRGELVGLWNQFLVEKYSNRTKVNETWKTNPLEAAEDPAKGTVPLAKIWEMTPGSKQRPDPRISDAHEFVYWLHRRYLKAMYDHLRTIGFQGVIFSNGDNVNLEMRRAAAEVLDATATAGYAQRMRPAYTYYATGLPVAGKPSINREWGPRNDIPNSWWAILPHVVTGKYLDQTYHFAFHTTAHHGLDHILPNETNNKWSFSGVAQNTHPTSAVGLMAAALALRNAAIPKSKVNVELGVSFDGTFADPAATGSGQPQQPADTAWFDWRPGLQKKSAGIPSLRYFFYWPMKTRFFDKTYDGNATVLTNLPDLPAGDFVKKAFVKKKSQKAQATKLVLVQPKSSYDRYGKKALTAKEYFQKQGVTPGTLTKSASVGLIAGDIDTDAEREALYRSFKTLGLEIPVTLEEFGKVWASTDKTSRLDLVNNQFTVDRPDLQAIAGRLAELAPKVSGIEVEATADAQGAVWQVPWTKGSLDRSMVIAAMIGRCTLTKPSHVGYVFAITRDLELRQKDKLLVSIRAPQKVHLAVKAATRDDVATCKNLYITPFRPLSNRVPITIAVAAGPGVKLFGCNADGEAILEIRADVDPEKKQLTFTTPNREDIAFYLVHR